ncbi:MAG: hypothetical protein IJX00_04820 [Clostridia bacterium]|nr:hypothetical protein [Clostridia bacterium]
MISTICDIVGNVVKFLTNATNKLGLDLLTIIALGVEVLLVLFFLIKSALSYESALNRALDKVNYWLFEKKVVTEENVRELNDLFKKKGPKRLCYYWQQYILFREHDPSEYLSTDNLIEKPLKTSSAQSNIKNLGLFTTIWAFIASMFILIAEAIEANVLTGTALVTSMLVALIICVIGFGFVAYMRARKNAVLNSLYQSVSLFGRFMDNACVDLPSYIDYQILFTPQEIEKGQPVLREFLDYKARKEKEEFNRSKEEIVEHVSYDFSETGVDGSIVLERAMRESELFLKKKERLLVKVSQLESELESRRKNFDNVQKESQTKIQASKENILRLRQMQEETTNRIESNYYRKQQTQEIAKQEQLEQEFEQQRAKYLLEKNEGEEEIKKLNDELEGYRKNVENAMLNEYQTFFNKFCKSAEKVVAKVFADKIISLKDQNAKDKEYITSLEIKLKNAGQGDFDLPSDPATPATTNPTEGVTDIPAEGRYDEAGNYLYPNGTWYDPQGNFHDENGNVYSQDGQLISSAADNAQAAQEVAAPAEEKKVVNFDDFDDFDFMTDVAQKDDIYNVAEKVIEEVDTDDSIEVVNNSAEEVAAPAEESPVVEEKKVVDDSFEDFDIDAQPKAEEKPALVDFDFDEMEEKSDDGDEEPAEAVEAQPKKKAGRPRKVVTEENQAPKRRVGRPKKVVTDEPAKEKRSVGRPKKIVKPAAAEDGEKRGRGRPKKTVESVSEINKKLSEEEARLSQAKEEIDNEIKLAANAMENNDPKQARREQLLKEIEALQNEAATVMGQEESEGKIAEINAKLENLLDEIKNLN